MRVVPFASLVLLAALGCSATSGTNGFTGGHGASGSGASGSGASTGAGNGGTGADGTGGETGFTTGSQTSQPGCSAAAELVYVLSTDNNLWSFAPDQKKFTLIGQLGCNVPAGATPNSMAVDRNAVAWVNYVSSDDITLEDTGGWVYQVSTTDASCQPSATFTLPSTKWYRLGMGFSTDTAGGTTETLYVTGTGSSTGKSPGLGKLDFGTKSLTTIGQFTGDTKLSGQSAELTGTGDARLFGFFTTTPVRIAQIDPGGAVLSDDSVSSVPTPMAWAFSFWGGAFYLYTSEDGFTPSTVTRWDPATKAVDTSYVLTAPMVIDGAGVSTCAPIGPTT